MILAALSLLAVGAADLIRQFVPAKRAWIGYVVGALATLALAAGADAGAAGMAAIAVAALWVMTVPAQGNGRGGFWPIGGFAALCLAAVALAGPRLDSGPLGTIWVSYASLGQLAFDRALLFVGAVVFLLESGNVIVRTALRSEGGVTEEADAAEASAPRTNASAAPILRGGRLIGPLERILVFALTLAGAYTLLAAVLAAKGIVRFPEISNDRGTGTRAEYFLVGSLVSWVIGLACALLVWWGAGLALV
jgi:hypothetical protein